MKSTDPLLAETPMGSKTIILSGNFRQVTSVIPKGSGVLILESYIQKIRFSKSLKQI